MKRPAFVDSILDRVSGAVAGATLGGESIVLALESAQEMRIKADTESSLGRYQDKMMESALAEIELALEDVSWRDLSSPYGTWQWSRTALRRMIALARVMYIVNPLIKRAVTVQELYVWGGGCTIKADDNGVQEVIDDFFEDPKNQPVIGNAWPEREREQRNDGNTFFIFFRNKQNGTARVRLLPVDQVEDIITNPEDSKEPWFYRRMVVTSDSRTNLDSGDPTPNNYKPLLIPDIAYNPKSRPSEIGGIPIKWDACILHLKTGGLSMMKFGMPELFSGLNWATAYKKILENFATILAAYARVAMTLGGNKNRKNIAAAKQKLGTALSNDKTLDNNPPENTASWMMLSGGMELKAVKTAHSTTGPDEARALRVMVSAGTDTADHFFGDSDVGNFATSSTLDRPTELKMISRQQMWANVILVICHYLKIWSAAAPQGKLRKSGWRAQQYQDPFDGQNTFRVVPKSGARGKVTVKFPPILERDLVERVRAVVQAITLNGSKAEGIIPDRKYAAKLLIEALGHKDADEIINILYPNAVGQGFIDPADELKIQQEEARAKTIQAKAAVKKAELSEKKPNNPGNPQQNNGEGGT